MIPRMLAIILSTQLVLGSGELNQYFAMILDITKKK